MLVASLPRCPAQARPAGCVVQKPGDVRRRDRRRARHTILAVMDPSLFVWSSHGLAVADGHLREPRARPMAEGRGKAQAATLRRARTETTARRLLPDGTEEPVAGVRPATG